MRAARLRCPAGPGQPLRDGVPRARARHALRQPVPPHRRAEPGRALKLERHPLDVGRTRSSTATREEGPGGHRDGARRGRAAEVGRHLPPAPGRRRLHAAHQGPRRRADRRPGPRDRRGRRRLRRGPRRQPGASATATATSRPARTSSCTGCASRTCPRSGSGFDEVGLTSVQACGDSARNVLGCPVAGVDADEVFDATPVAQAISGFLHRQSRVRQPAPQVQDQRHRLPRRLRAGGDQRHRPVAGPRRRRRGRVSTCSSAAASPTARGWRRTSTSSSRIDEAVECTRAIAQLFGELGNRENRGLGRMRYLVQELGPEGVPGRAGRARSGFALVPAGESSSPGATAATTSASTPSTSRASSTSAARCRSGGCSGLELVEAARLAETYGDGESGSAPTRTSSLTGVPTDVLDDAAGRAAARSSTRPFPGPFTRGVVACTGSEFCRFASSRPRSGPSSWACRAAMRQLRRPCLRCDQRACATRRRRRRGDPHALLGLLGLVRPAPDRRHRLPGRHRPRRRAHRRGGRHRPRRLARHRRRLHRLGGRRGAGRRACPRRSAAARRAVRARAPRPTSRSTPGPPSDTPIRPRTELRRRELAVTHQDAVEVGPAEALPPFARRR